MQALLKIPFNDKDEAKEIAKNNQGRLYFDGDSKLWKFEGNSLPRELTKYVVPGSQIKDAVKPAPIIASSSKFSFLNKKPVITNNPFDDGHNIESIASNSYPQPTQVSNAITKYYSYVLDIPFQQRDALSGVGGRYHSLFKTYIVKTADASHLPPLWRAHPYSYEAWIEKFINFGKVSSDIEPQFADNDSMTARGYQEKARDMAINAYNAKLGGFLIADEVGLGKTISAAIVAKHNDFKSMLIVTTLSATAHWRKTFLKFNFKGKEILIINYDRLQKLFKPDSDTLANKTKTTRKKKNKAVAKKFLAPLFDLVVWDESHKLKNATSIRSKLAMKIQVNSKFNLYLSATAGQNPLELSYLAPLLARITGDNVKNLSDFEAWCISQNLGVSRGKFGKWNWDKDMESIKRMHSLLFEGSIPGAVRRTPQDIAGWPEINRILQPYEMDPEEAQAYELSWIEFCNNYNKIKKENPKSAAASRQSEHLRFRQKSSLLKVAYTIEQTLELIEAGHSVAISVGFRQTMFELEKKLKSHGLDVSLIYGGQNATEKEESRMNFQEDRTQVVIFTVEEAISLHQGEYPLGVRARSMIIHDLRWSAISMAQIEGRTHRDGKFSQIYWGFFDSTVDSQIAQIVLSRLISMKTMVGDDTQTLAEIEKFLEGIIEERNALVLPAK